MCFDFHCQCFVILFSRKSIQFRTSVVKLVTRYNFIRKHMIEFMQVNVFFCFRRRRRPVRDELEQDAKQEEYEEKWQRNRVKTINL